MTALAESLAAYVSLCAIGTAAGVTLTGVACPELPGWARLFLSPVACVASWAVFLGGGVALGVPVRSLVGPLWVATLVLAACGLWRLVRRGRSEVPGRRDVATLGLTVVLPVAALWPFFWYGLADYPGSVAPDGWSYVAYGQFLWDHRRFEDGGLAPLYQYASHLSITRHVSASLLPFLAVWMRVFVPSLPPADAQTALGLLFAWDLYALGSACAAVATLIGLRPAWVPGYLAAAVVSGWTANLVYANNLDNGTALALFPGLFTLVALLQPGSWRGALLSGLGASALLYTHAEMAAPVGLTLAFLATHRARRERLPLRAWSWTLGLALVAALVLTAPFLQSLIAFMRLQSYNALTVRVGGTLFDGLTSPAHIPSAIWALGGEHRIDSGLLGRNVLGGLYSVAALAGLWGLLKQRQHALLFTSGLVLGGFGFLAFAEGYGYGAYKVLLMGWWMIALLPAVGLAHVSRAAPRKAVFASATGLALAALGATVFHEGLRMTRNTATYLQNSMARVRAVGEVAGIVGERGVVLAVDGAWVNQWAVYFLRDRRVRVEALRSYMAQPWVVPFMERAAPVPLEDVRYLLTDDRLDGGLGGPPVWAGGPYRLWSLPADWAVIVEVGGPHGAESQGGRPVLVLGPAPVGIEILASRGGTLMLRGSFVPLPARPAGVPLRVQVSRDGSHQTDVTDVAGDTMIAMPVVAGSNRILLRCPEATVSVQDVRVCLDPQAFSSHGDPPGGR